MGFICRLLGMLSFGNIADDGDAANDLTTLVPQRRVVTFKEPRASGLGYGIGPVFSCYSSSRQGLEQIFFLTGFFQKGENIEGTFSQNLVSANAGNKLHGPVPGDVSTFAIKSEYAVNARVDQGQMKVLVE